MNQADANDLLARIKQRRPALAALLEECNDHWGYEDGIYRFYQLQGPPVAGSY